MVQATRREHSVGAIKRWEVGVARKTNFLRMENLLAFKGWRNLGSSHQRSVMVYTMPEGYSAYRQSAGVCGF